MKKIFKKRTPKESIATSVGDNESIAAFDGLNTPLAFPQVAPGGLVAFHKKRTEELNEPSKFSSKQKAQIHAKLTNEKANVYRFVAGRRALNATLQLDDELNEIVIMSSGRLIGKIDVGQIEEIRVGQMAVRCVDFEKSADAGNASAKMAFTFCYGTKFKLKQMCFIAGNPDDVHAWTQGLTNYTRKGGPHRYTTDMVKRRWLRKTWASLQRDGVDHITVKEFKLWLQKANLKLATKETKDLFNSVDEFGEGKIRFNKFMELYHDMCDDVTITQMFDRFSSDTAKIVMGKQDIINFFRKENKESISDAYAKSVIERYGENGTFSVSNFIEFLHGNENEICDPMVTRNVHEDMKQPLTHYFHASSHNTYLMGDQFRSQSSVEAYIKVLRDGCRCVEIDCWDGPNGDPIVYHGLTLTSKIKFRDVLPVIVEHGFETSKYPLILSIENHCSVDQQKVMAHEFKSQFRDSLVTMPYDSKESKYPSPEQLEYRVIIKHKKLEAGKSEIETRRDGDEDLSESIKNGYLKLEAVDGSWTTHYFVLTSKKLTYTEEQEEADKVEEEDDEGVELYQVPPVDSKEQELHYGEAWFHGKLRDGSKTQGRVIAERLLRNYMKEHPREDHDGLFLVRESDTYPEEFSLTFWRTDVEKAEHCRIRCRGNKFFLTDQVAFINLYELIEYYRREALKSITFEITLAKAVPQPPAHINEPWYHKDVSRSQAEDMLKRLRVDGAFLVRDSTSEANGLSISFRAEGKIKHCRVRKEGRMYTIGDTDFPTMNEMVTYYKKHPLYRKMRLRYAVNEELLKQQGAPPEDSIYVVESLYQTPNSVQAAQKANGADVDGVTVKALYGYKAAQEDELSFPVDAIISDVDKKDGGWWYGSYGGSQGWLPSNYVKELDPEALEKVLKEDEEDNPLGDLEQNSMPVQGLEVEPKPSKGEQRLVCRIFNGTKEIYVGVDTEEEMKDWATKIRTAASMHAERAEGLAKKEKKMKISSDLSDLIFYCHPIRFKDFETCAENGYQLMSSFNEKRAFELCSEKRGLAGQFVKYNTRSFARVYPAGRRVDSSNFDPQPMWNCGIQLVALNYQTPDRPMWINHGRFSVNGRSGYVLKPKVMRDPKLHFDPFNKSTWKPHVKPLTVDLRVLSARHLVKPGRGIASPYVEVDIVGVDADLASKQRTAVVQDNGFKPFWNYRMTMVVSMPELASLCITVFDEDMFGDSNAIGQAVLPLGNQNQLNLRSGWRSVQLKSISSAPLELSSLLVHVSFSYGGDEYESLQDLRVQMRRLNMDRDQLVKERADATRRGQSLHVTDQRLEEVNKQMMDIGKQLMAKETPAARVKR
eukprot:m.339251 g.339251  ORF g.339251 m.339251 type:complete len:1330 (+) comp18723_c0_seq1:312-4301(+)